MRPPRKSCRRSAAFPSRACARRCAKAPPSASSRTVRYRRRASRIGSRRGDREIAGRDQLATGRGGDALHGRDHRLRQRHDGLHHGAAGFHDVPGNRPRPPSASARRAVISLRSWPAAERRARSRSARRRAIGCGRRQMARRRRRVSARAILDRLLRACGRLSVSEAMIARRSSRSRHGSGRRPRSCELRRLEQCHRSMSRRPSLALCEAALRHCIRSRAATRRGGGSEHADRWHRHMAGCCHSVMTRRGARAFPRRRSFRRLFNPQSGLSIEAVWPGGCRVRQAYSAQFIRPGGTISGPTMMALADFAHVRRGAGRDRPGAARGHHQSQHQFSAQAASSAI